LIKKQKNMSTKSLLNRIFDKKNDIILNKDYSSKLEAVLYERIFD